MGLPVSLILIAVGLILALAVDSTSSAVDVNTVGWILFAVGAFGLLLTVLFWDSLMGGGYFHRHGYEAPPPRRRRPPGRARRRTTVEEEDGPPRRYY